MKLFKNTITTRKELLSFWHGEPPLCEWCKYPFLIAENYETKHCHLERGCDCNKAATKGDIARMEKRIIEAITNPQTTGEKQ